MKLYVLAAATVALFAQDAIAAKKKTTPETTTETSTTTTATTGTDSTTGSTTAAATEGTTTTTMIVRSKLTFSALYRGTPWYGKGSALMGWHDLSREWKQYGQHTVD